MHDSVEPLYQAVADDLASLIASGQLPARSRVPSVRRLARQRGISVTTAVASLRVLEQRGLIEAQPRSGYFVVPPRAPPAPPSTVTLPRTARLAGAQAMLKRFAEASLDPTMVRLGEAIPDPALFPQAHCGPAWCGRRAAIPPSSPPMHDAWEAVSHCARRLPRTTPASACGWMPASSSSPTAAWRP